MRPLNSKRPDVGAAFRTHLRLLEDRTRRIYDRNDAIYTMGDLADALYLVESGAVKIGVISAEGKEKTLHVCGPGEFFGELCLCGVARRPEQAMALVSSTVESFSVQSLASSVMGRRPQLVTDFLQVVGQRLLDCQEHAVGLAYDTVPRRLANPLLRLADSSGERRRRSVLLSLSPTHEELASIVGTSRGMISTVMSEFRRRGLVDYTPQTISVFTGRVRKYLKTG